MNSRRRRRRRIIDRYVFSVGTKTSPIPKKLRRIRHHHRRRRHFPINRPRDFLQDDRSKQRDTSTRATWRIIVREAIRVAMKRVILERYILTGWSSEIIREAVRGLNDVRDCSVDVVDNAVTDSTSERRRRNDRCRGDDGDDGDNDDDGDNGDDGDDEDDGRFISIVSNKVPSWRPTSRRYWRLLRKHDFRSFFTRIVKLLRKKYKLRRRRSAGERKRDVVETRSTCKK